MGLTVVSLSRVSCLTFSVSCLTVLYELLTFLTSIRAWLSESCCYDLAVAWDWEIWSLEVDRWVDGFG